MKRPSFLFNVCLAFILATIAGVGFELFKPFVTTALLARVMVLVTATGYVIYLLRYAQQRSGRLAVFCLWILSASAAWILSPTFLWFVAFVSVLISLVRILYYHRTFVGGLSDVLLSGIALLAAIATVTHTQSFFLTVWVYLLMHSLFVFLPISLKPFGIRRTNEEDAFSRAYSVADNALRRLSNP